MPLSAHPLLSALALAAGLLAVPAVAAPAAEAAAGAAARTVTGPVVSDAWIAEAPPGAAHNAAYLRLANGSRADVLEAVASPVCRVVELHAMQATGGVLRMRREPVLALAPGARIELAPGGRHLMLIDMKRALAVGEKVPLTLRFRKAGTVTVEAEVRPRPLDDAPAPGGHAHHHHH